MAKDRNTPALYEVFGRSSSAPARPVDVSPSVPPPRVHVESIAPDTAVAPAGPTSPRLIRLPIGYIYVGIAVVVLAIVASYFVGVSRGRQQVLESSADTGSEALPINDPTLTVNPGAQRDRPASNAGGGTSTPPSSGSTAAAPNPGTPGKRTLDRDTRQSGLNYIIIERFEPEEAWAVKEFLQRNGIDVLVLRDNNKNSSLYQVVTAEGFRGWSSNAAAQALDKRLDQLGRQWKSRERGSKDFSLRLPKRYE